MKERPILFSGAMVRAILDGSKTQTRRVVKPQPMSALAGMIQWKGGMFAPQTYGTDSLMLKHCPYGKPGDRLWVRETWGIHKPQTARLCTMPAFEYQQWDEAGNPSLDPEYDLLHRATAEVDGDFPIRWRPSIYMPRWASRLTLEIVSVRVERLQDISEADAMTEGVETFKKPLYADEEVSTYANAFARLWDSINGPGSWESNPWVWVVEFKVVTS